MAGKKVSRVVMRLDVIHESGDRIGIDQTATAEDLLQYEGGPLTRLESILGSLWRKVTFEITDDRFPLE